MDQLADAGFDVTSDRVDTAEGVEAALDHGGWDMIFSNYTLPQLSGTDVLRMIRERDLKVPFLFVSSDMSEEAVGAAMNAGAQDCLLKSNLARFIPVVEQELRAAEALRKYEEAQLELKKLSTAVAHTVSCIVITDREGVIEYVNPSFERTTRPYETRGDRQNAAHPQVGRA